MQSTRAQMRKWLNREESARSSPSLTPPDLSDSFEEFVRPLIGHRPPGFRLAKLREPLLLAAAVWNAVIASNGDLGRAVADVTEMMAELQRQPVSPKILTMLEVLAARKSTSFGDDHRPIADLEVRRQGADVRVVARGMTAAVRLLD